MRVCYLTYWTSELVDAELGRPMRHCSNNQFLARGVGAGDRVYAVNWRDGVLHVVGRMDVEACVDRATAVGLLGDDGIWTAADHLLARPGTASTVERRPLPDDVVAAIAFATGDGTTVAPARRRDGRVDPQTFRATREITTATARAFDRVLDGRASP